MSPAVDIISLGCSKNLVDSERLIRQFEINGYRVNHDPQTITADIVVVNTCGFIADAKQESIDMILQCCQKKTDGEIKRLYVMGCLSERYFEELGQEIPEVDKFYGKFNWTELLNDLGKNYCKEREVERHITTPSHYAYLKISEGCDRHCAFCAIPIITGAHKSRPMEQIIEEVEMLVGEGVREFQIIAQELTYYGIDLYGERRIAQLVRQIADVEGVEWVRLHYAYPKDFPFELLDVMNEKPNVCRYLDIALQHVSTKVLNNMNRHIDKEQTYSLVRTIREKVPGIHLRTTLMVGFPGEGEQEFQELKEFVRWAKFERMGAFAYSEEDGTPAERKFSDDVDEETKQARLSELMALQQTVSEEIQQQKVGTVMKVIIDRKEGDYYIGRTEFDSPEVDPEVLIKSDNIPIQIGQFYSVRITDADEFDLYASLA